MESPSLFVIRSKNFSASVADSLRFSEIFYLQRTFLETRECGISFTKVLVKNLWSCWIRTSKTVLPLPHSLNIKIELRHWLQLFGCHGSGRIFDLRIISEKSLWPNSYFRLQCTSQQAVSYIAMATQSIALWKSHWLLVLRIVADQVNSFLS